MEIYRDLIGMARRGTLVEALPLSMRYLYRVLGRDGLEQVFARFWKRASPEPFMSDEAGNFARFVGSEIDLPHLGEVIGFELAGHRAAMTGAPQSVSFTCDPAPLLLALKSGAASLPIDPAEVEVEVTPPSRYGPAEQGRSRTLEDGAQGRDRTTDTVIFSHVLYQLSYLGLSASAEASAYRGA